MVERYSIDYISGCDFITDKGKYVYYEDYQELEKQVGLLEEEVRWLRQLGEGGI